MDGLEELRKAIDGIDSVICDLLRTRKELVLKVAEYKRINEMPVLDSKREEEKLESLKKRANDDIEEEYIIKIFQNIMDESKKIQNDYLK